MDDQFKVSSLDMYIQLGIYCVILFAQMQIQVLMIQVLTVSCLLPRLTMYVECTRYVITKYVMCKQGFSICRS